MKVFEFETEYDKHCDHQSGRVGKFAQRKLWIRVAEAKAHEAENDDGVQGGHVFAVELEQFTFSF